MNFAELKPETLLAMRNTISILLLCLLLGITLIAGTSCNRNTNIKGNSELPYGMHEVTIVEVIQSTNYTYLEVEENNEKFWIAVSLREAKQGDVLYYTDALEMRDFNSKELNRTFPVIYFVQDPSNSPETEKATSPSGKQTTERVKNIKIESIEGGISLSELFENQNDYQNKSVKIRGLVLKVNDHIMGKNWVHIQDGTGSDEFYDLTITTMDDVKVGNIATFEGKIALKKDFGSGYAYDIIMEEATVTDVKTTPVVM